MKKIAITIDDDSLSRFIINTSVRKFDFDLIEAASGSEALRKILDKKLMNMDISLMIVDMMIPGMTGLELIESLKRLNIHIPMIAVSEYLDKTLTDSLFNLNIFHILQKPYKSDELEKNIKIVMKNIIMEERNGRSS